MNTALNINASIVSHQLWSCLDPLYDRRGAQGVTCVNGVQGRGKTRSATIMGEPSKGARPAA